MFASVFLAYCLFAVICQFILTEGCPTEFIPTQQYEIVGDCTVHGQLGLSNTGAVTVYNGTFTINGNLMLMDSSQMNIINGVLQFPQTTNFQWGIYLENNAILQIKNSELITNNSTAGNSYSMSLTAYDNAITMFVSSFINTNAGSWLLGNYNEDSAVVLSNSQNLPTELYPAGSATVHMKDRSNIATVWLNFVAGSAATFSVPSMNSDGLFDFTFGLTTGFDYFVNISDSYCRLGLNSYPLSTMIVESDETSTGKVPLVFGYYIQNTTSDVLLSNLTVGNNISLEYTDQGRVFQLKNVYLNPFSWQIYVSYTNSFTVTIINSLINEIGIFSEGVVVMKNCVMQLAVLEAGGPGANAMILDSQIWSQSIMAIQGGVMHIVNSSIHGNYVDAADPGSFIIFDGTEDLRNGNASITNCNANSAGYPPNINGVPLCSPYFPLHRCADIVESDDGLVNEVPYCVAYSTAPTMTPTPGPPISGCPSVFVPTEQYVIVGDCVVYGQLALSNSGAVAFYNGTLTIYGNLVLMGNAQLDVLNGALKFPQIAYSQYGIYLENNAILQLKNSELITNNSTDDNNYSMALTAYDNAIVVFESSFLDTNTGSWLLGNFNEESVVVMSNSQNLPTEVYPAGSATVLMKDRTNIAGIWLNFIAGSAATLEVPLMNSNGLYDFTFGLTTGFDYFVNISNSYCRLGFNSYPFSTMIVQSDGSSVGLVPLVFGYYIQNTSSDILLSNLTVGNNISLVHNDQGRVFQLKNVYLNPFSWQVYISFTNSFQVTVSESLINEIGVFTEGVVVMKNCVTQLAVLEVAGSGASIFVLDSQIWSQSIMAVQGGVMHVVNSSIHGNYVNAADPGSFIIFEGTQDLRNGNSSITNCNPNSAGYTPNINGVPLCNPYFALHRCADIVESDDGAINEIPFCAAYPTPAPTLPPVSNPTVTPTAGPSLSNNDDSSSNSNSFWSSAGGTGAIVGIVAGVCVLGVAVAWAVFWRQAASGASGAAASAASGNPVTENDATVNALFNKI